MPKAPLNYAGYAHIRRQIYFYKNYENDPESIKYLDMINEVVYIVTYKKEGLKEENIDIWYYDDQIEKIVYESYTYFKPHELYISDNNQKNKYIYFIDVNISNEEYQQMSINRSKIIFEELVSKVYHPTRIIRLLELGYDIEDL
jgi:hypothetical protein